MSEKSFLLATEVIKLQFGEHTATSRSVKSLSGQIALDQNNKVKTRNWWIAVNFSSLNIDWEIMSGAWKMQKVERNFHLFTRLRKLVRVSASGSMHDALISKNFLASSLNGCELEVFMRSWERIQFIWRQFGCDIKWMLCGEWEWILLWWTWKFLKFLFRR